MYLCLPKHLRAPLLNAGGFNPLQLSAVTAWLRLQTSAQTGGEWTNWVDVLNSNPGAINSARRPAVGAAGNGLPIATFATNDCVSVPLIAANNQTTKMGWAFWFRVAAIGAAQALVNVTIGTGGASARKIRLDVLAAGTMRGIAYISGANGRSLITTAAVTGATWTWVRLKYDSSLGGDPNLTLYLNGVNATGAYANVGAGGTLGVLPTVTGNLLIGNENNGATPALPLGGDIGPNIFFLGDDITAAQETALMNFERPT